MNVFSNISTDLEPSALVKMAADEKQNELHRGDIIFTASSESSDECGMSSVVTEEPPTPLFLNSFCFALRPHDPDLLDPEFSKHLFRSDGVRRQIAKTANGVTRFNIAKHRFNRIQVPIPDRNKQRRIASQLDQLSEMTTSLTSGLPAEIAARRKQYEYYRDRLLTFKETA